MARTSNPEVFAAKRTEILDAAQSLVFTRGFEQMSIQDILDKLRISSGAFHHYFGSREALLEAFIERIKQDSGRPLLNVLQTPHLTALQKLQAFFDALDSLGMAYKAEAMIALRVWYTDDNAIVRQKVDQAAQEQRAPLLTEIVRQGLQEGVFTSTYPELAGEVIVSLLQSMSNTHARLLLSLIDANETVSDDHLQSSIAKIVATHAAYMEAIERVLGAPPNSLARTSVEAVKAWATPLEDIDST